MMMLSTKDFETHCNITSTTVPHISMTDIRDFSVIIPPSELQNEFSKFTHQLDKSEFAIKKSIEKLELFKSSLMQEYFG